MVIRRVLGFNASFLSLHSSSKRNQADAGRLSTAFWLIPAASKANSANIWSQSSPPMVGIPSDATTWCTFSSRVTSEASNVPPPKQYPRILSRLDLVCRLPGPTLLRAGVRRLTQPQQADH